ncbi:MAG: HDOD domain-containing protein [Phycisphaerae bacterium]
MGWWHWIVEALTGSSTPAEDNHTSQDKQSAVAVAEPPASKPEDSSITADTPNDGEWWDEFVGSATDLIPPERPDLAHEDRAFENLLISNFDGHNLTLPPMPGTLERVLANLRDPSCEFGKIADIIGEDQANAAAVLRIVNSPLYRGLEDITSLKLAITRLGAKAVRTLMMHQAMRKSVFSGKSTLKPLVELIWKRSLASACIMRSFSTVMKLDEEDCFLIGLLHGIGNVIVLRCAQDASDLRKYDVPYDIFEFLCYECQQEFGELIAEEWKLPDLVRSLVVNHHDYPTEDDPLRNYRLMLRITQMVNCNIGYGADGSYDVANCKAAQDLGIDGTPAYLSFLRRIPGELDEQIEAL